MEFFWQDDLFIMHARREACTDFWCNFVPGTWYLHCLTFSAASPCSVRLFALLLRTLHMDWPFRSSLASTPDVVVMSVSTHQQEIPHLVNAFSASN